MPDAGVPVAPAPATVGEPQRSGHRLRWLLGGVLLCVAGIGMWLILHVLLKPAPSPPPPAITSPISARTGVRLIDSGNIVQTTGTTGLVVVTQIEPISMLLTLPEDDFGVVSRQMAAGPPTAAVRCG